AAKLSRVALVPGCTAAEGQGGGQLIGRCYVVLYRGALSPERRDGHENLLALTVSLPGLSPARVGIDFNDLSAVKTARAAEIASFSGIVQHFDPIWSPDGARLLYTVWDSGQIRLELLDPSSGNVTRFEPLEGQMTVRPIWSDDSRFVAYASLQTVKVFDTQTRTTRTLRRQTSSSEMRTAILFEGARLRILFDHMTTEGELLDYDAAQGNLQKQQYASGAGRPEWVRRAEKHGLALDLHASLKPVRSPTGRFVAFFTFVGGQRRSRQNSNADVAFVLGVDRVCQPRVDVDDDGKRVQLREGFSRAVGQVECVNVPATLKRYLRSIGRPYRVGARGGGKSL